ncbi:MAG: cobyric acid synthase [Lachnospiraceae bacterium]|nr:cobyric acid synthase [Lachnospiraceae bacterium]
MAYKIMVQGTMSNAGKSLVVTGLARLFARKGYKTAPFKSQNMALNSFITEDGYEIGRAQAVQAEAAGVTPEVYMNPVLLKPVSEMGSQVIVNGKVVCNMKAKDYFQYKPKIVPDIMAAFNYLDQKYDIVIIEGAGSPAEINLKENDIVNMGLAKMTDAPVLLVGDIDRGGVFAQLYGTIALLEEDERSRIKGLLINKFRGDKSILVPGLKMLEDKCSKPVWGVIPYINIDIEDEDSLSERLSGNQCIGIVDIVVIKLPRISNFTDFNVFGNFDGVSLRYVDNVKDLKEPDIIFIPGTKNTIKDLMWIRQNGIEAAIKKANSKGCVVFGICGGYQMLGDLISDPYNTEEGGNARGMGLIGINTVFGGSKKTVQVAGRLGKINGIFEGISGKEYNGYEIHIGMTDRNSHDDICQPVNISASHNNVYGSYIHGLFDSGDIAFTMVKALAGRKGAGSAAIKSFNYKEYKERQYNILADAIRDSVDMDKICRCMGMEN